MKAILAAILLGAASAAPAAPDDLFHQLQANAWYLTTGDRTSLVYVTSLGRGPRVVVLHGGFGANLYYMVRAIEPHLGVREFVLYDQRGSLLSPHRAALDTLSVENLVDDLERLRVQLGEERLVLFAHSMGSRLAYEYLRRFPDRVAGLILVGAFPPRGGGSFDAINQRGTAMTSRPEVAAVLAAEGVAELTEASTDRQRTLNWRIRFAGVNMVHVERWRDMEGGRAFYNGETGGRLGNSLTGDWDVPAMLGARRIPISVIQGDQDYVDPSAAGWSALAGEGGPLVRCLNVTPIRDGGHAVWLDDPRGFAAAVTRALERSAC
ncbi:alpha/beta hydrolase [Sphingosinicella sp. LHD-64]|uniref:alpha/beta fold hydrolase n=1 Tax=Sphingosinicella sp. LHD-64 TaxID=3072139 RepID=UPI00280F8752|nr:alpha/beta hydrolase [Sphingosinicella sp. LHD-64]MDQ8755901.1 alpha/beta hydrolase [Sphingosinicella sp. LHD-64]